MADPDRMDDLANAFYDIYYDRELTPKYDLIKPSRIDMHTSSGGSCPGARSSTGGAARAVVLRSPKLCLPDSGDSSDASGENARAVVLRSPKLCLPDSDDSSDASGAVAAHIQAIG